MRGRREAAKWNCARAACKQLGLNHKLPSCHHTVTAKYHLTPVSARASTRLQFSARVEKFITGQNEREETTQDAIVTKSAAFASYEINYLTYITATYTRAKRRWHGACLYTVPGLARGSQGRDSNPCLPATGSRLP
jgi:hypothetical protein